VRVWLLGGFRVTVGSRSIGEEQWRLRKAARLVKLLALAEGHRLNREQAMEWLWPDLDAKAASNNLHRTLYFARRLLEPEASDAASRYLRLQGEQLRLCPQGPLWVDVEAFEEATATARYSREPAAYRVALELYAGELLPKDRYEEWAERRREELRNLYLALLLELARLYEERKEFGEAIETLGRVVAEEPTHERAHVGLMRLYALLGRRREALRHYERLREALFKEFGTEPEEEASRLQQEIWAGTFPPTDSPAATGFTAEESPFPAGAGVKHNLPLARTSFVGREGEKLEVKRLLAMTRLLALTGAGGCGKTRLALEVARDLVGAYPEGVWMVELAPLSEPKLVPQAVAQALGVREQPNRPLLQTLKDTLRAKKMLLVMDNCEHLLGAVARLVDALLDSCPVLRVLATSRETLNAADEVSWVVPSLTVPADFRQEEAYTAGQMEAYESVRLFLERARQRDPSFALSPRNGQAVAQVCRRLEGIPLAIELAAARMEVLSAEQLASRLEDPLKLLSRGGWTAEPRHQTLRATLEWSFELLSEAERALFRRLAVFAGRWTLEAAEAVCSAEDIDEDDVLDLLSELVEKSLVVAEAGEEEEEGVLPRFRMLEPIRQYARERLKQSGESEVARSRHARYYLKLAERVEPELVGNRPMAALKRLELESGNLRAALSWVLDADEKEEPTERAEMGLRLAAALGRFWDAHGPGEGRRWLEKGLAKSGAAPASVRAKALNEAGFIAVYEGDPKAMALLEESLAIYKELKDRSGVASSMSNLGHAVLHLGQRERMMSLREEVEALLSEPMDKRMTAHLLAFLGFAAASEGDVEQLRVRQEEALALFREVGDIRSIAMCLLTLGWIALPQGDGERAAVLFEEGLLLQRELKYKTAIFFGLAGMAGVAALREQPARAAKLMGASEALREVLGLSLASLSHARYDYEGCIAAVRAGLGEEAFEAAWSEGRAMSPEQAIEYALSEEERDAPAVLTAPEQPPAGKPADRLTRREREVALLVARELTNRQIALELSISEHTVANHVRKILKKLRLHSRAQIESQLIL
jgi:predicted ATPase/DNA-binding SARP family transcriptional activator/DNA-binding CsgD family transcriptional regulator